MPLWVQFKTQPQSDSFKMFLCIFVALCLMIRIDECSSDCRPFGTQPLTFGTFFPNPTTLSGNKGLLTTPNYPLNYSPFEQCAWVIWGPEKSNITIEFTVIKITFYVDKSAFPTKKKVQILSALVWKAPNESSFQVFLTLSMWKRTKFSKHFCSLQVFSEWGFPKQDFPNYKFPKINTDSKK